MSSLRVTIKVLYVLICVTSCFAIEKQEVSDYFDHVVHRIHNTNAVIGGILTKLESNRQFPGIFKQRKMEEDCDEPAKNLPEYTESLPEHARDLSQLHPKKNYPICHFNRQIQRLNTLEYEYKPAYYEEIKCLNSDFDDTRDSDEEICSSIGFSCIQWNKTIHLTRKPYNSRCWEALSMVIPAGCECMWPAHKLGDISAHV